MISNFAAPEEFASLLKVITETGQAATVGSEIMNRLIAGAGGLAGAHKAVIEEAKQSMNDFGMTAEGLAEKTRTAIESTFSALNIDVQQNLNGVNTKTQQTFDLIANGAKSVAESTYSATEKAQLLSALFAEGLNAAKTKEEFAALDDVTKHYGLSSVVTADQQKILQAGIKGGTDAATLAADATAKQNEALSENVVKTNASTDATNKNAEARREQSITTWNASFATDAAMQSESASLAVMQQMTDTIKTKISALNAMGATTEQVDATWRNLTDSMEGREFTGIQDFANSLQRVDDIVTKQIDSFTNAKSRADDMTRALGSGAVSSRDLADAQHALRQATDASVQGIIRMDEQTLSGLQNAIDSARARMQGLSDDAKNTADNLEATLAKLQGNEDRAREIEQAQKLADIQEQLNEARERGNAEEVAQLNRALSLQKQINSEENKKASAAAQQATQQKSSQAASSYSAPSSNTNVVKTIAVQLKSATGTVNATIPESQEAMFNAFVKQLQDSRALSGQ